jgi:hypothetical protein
MDEAEEILDVVFPSGDVTPALKSRILEHLCIQIADREPSGVRARHLLLM